MRWKIFKCLLRRLIYTKLNFLSGYRYLDGLISKNQYVTTLISFLVVISSINIATMNCIWSTKANGALILISNMKVVLLTINAFSPWLNFQFLFIDLNAANAFISKLPSLPSRSSIQPMIKKLYTNCMNIRSEERTQENLQVLKTILESARKFSNPFHHLK